MLSEATEALLLLRVAVCGKCFWGGVGLSHQSWCGLWMGLMGRGGCSIIYLLIINTVNE